MMRRRPALVAAMVIAAAFTLSLAAFGQATTVSAAGPPTFSVAGPPRNAHHYPLVPGVNGSSSSIDSMNIDLGDKIQMVINLAPVTAAQADMSVTEYRLAKINRNYVQISGRYCHNKTGGDVFLADGAPMEAGLTCSS